jgi:SAM-dependent methyltransferase
VTAVDGSPTAIEILKNRAATSGLKVDARVADLERGEYAIEAGKWDLIVIAFYLQRDLFDPAVKGLKPGGILIAIVHITDNEEEATKHRLLPGELPTFFTHQEIVSLKEGKPTDPAHKRSAAEIVVRRPQTRSTTQ